MMIKKLEKEFTGRGQVRGFLFTRLKKNKHAFIYKVSDRGIIHYEIFYRRVNTRHNCESYPQNKSFGKWGWTTRDIAEALDTYKELTINSINKLHGKLERHRL